MRAIVVLLSMGSPYVQIAHWSGRYFVRDGHHRAVGLLARGIHVVPAILIKARSGHIRGRTRCGTRCGADRHPNGDDKEDELPHQCESHRTLPYAAS